MKEIIDELLKNDKILEAITKLREIVPERSDFDELILQAGRLSKLERDNRKGLLKLVEYNIERNKIRSSILEFSRLYSSSEINKPSKKNLLQRFYFCKNINILKDIYNQRLHYFPEEKVVILQNNVFHHYNSLIAKYNINEVDPYSDLKYFDSVDEYISKNPSSSQVNKGKGDFPYFQFKRRIDKTELKTLRKNYNWAIRELIDLNISPIEYVHAVATMEGECGGSGKFIEHFNFKPIWGSFLLLKNISTEYLRLDEMIVKEMDKKIELCSIDNIPLLEQNFINFPNMMVEPRQAVIIPLGLIICPYKAPGYTPYSKKIAEVDRSKERYCSISEEPNYDKYTNINEYKLVGNFQVPIHLKYEISGQVLEQDLYELNLSKIYSIDQEWMCGSCPHIFLLSNDNNLIYLKSIFAQQENKSQIEEINIPKGYKQIIIAEIEDEITSIKYIKLNNKKVYNDLVLVKGDSLKIEINEGDKIKLEGFYKKISNIKYLNRIESNNTRNNLIKTYQIINKVEYGT